MAKLESFLMLVLVMGSVTMPSLITFFLVYALTQIVKTHLWRSDDDEHGYLSTQNVRS